MSDDDQAIRWARGTPSEAQREMERLARDVFHRASRTLRDDEGGVFVEGMNLVAPCDDEASFRTLAGGMFDASIEWLSRFSAEDAPHTLFLFGSEPAGRLGFRIVCLDLAALIRAIPYMCARFRAPYALVVHSTLQAIGSSGEHDLSPAERLAVAQSYSATHDPNCMPWGYRRRLVARAYDGRTGREREWAWMQTFGDGTPREEFHPRKFAPYMHVDADAEPTTPLADA